MRFGLLFSLLLFFLLSCKEAPRPTAELIKEAEKTATEYQVDLGCGLCTYHVNGVQRCELYFKVNDKLQAVEGHNTSPMNLGLCKIKEARPGRITGAYVDGKFIATRKARLRNRAPKGHDKDNIDEAVPETPVIDINGIDIPTLF